MNKQIDNINHPTHYTQSAIQPIEVIGAWKLSYCLGNTIKYIARADHKGNKLEDLQKARWYLNKELEDLERNR